MEIGNDKGICVITWMILGNYHFFSIPFRVSFFGPVSIRGGMKLDNRRFSINIRRENSLVVMNEISPIDGFFQLRARRTDNVVIPTQAVEFFAVKALF